MTQRERVLKMLRDAGMEGVRSDTFVAAYMPRAAARIKELRDAGYNISSTHERQFVRYVLEESAGVGAGTCGDRHGGSAEYDAEVFGCPASAPPASVDPNASNLAIGSRSSGEACESASFPTDGNGAGDLAPPMQDSPALQLFEAA